ncbi:MAG: hypothetical protein GX279_00105 [Clostridiaceae bacterium]|nr:hypothetical protein [Clostridiaceae bacterium]
MSGPKLHSFLRQKGCAAGDKSVFNGTADAVMASKGALTVEAALILPLILCAFFSVVFIIKTVCTYEMIQHAIDETASEIAASSYIYHMSGIRDLHDTVRNGINDRSDKVGEQIGSVIDAYDSLKEIGSGVKSGGLEGAAEDVKAIEDASQKFDEIFQHSKDIVSDPLDELKSIAFFIAGGSFDDIKTQLYIPVVKLYMKKHLKSESYPDADERLRSLGIVDGFDGLDFSGSSFLSDRDECIDIVVRYRVKLPLPLQFYKDMEFVQRVKVKAWMGGDEKTGVLDGSTASEGEDIWSLSNFQRGLKLRRIFGGNLPNSFPVIARYENGKAVMIKSMDLTAVSYQRPSNTEKTLKGYINELSKYNGQNKPWGSGNILIRGDDILQKELLLIIPENDPGDSNSSVLLDMKEYARSRGVSLVVKKYGMKRTVEESESAAGQGDGQAEGPKDGQGG